MPHEFTEREDELEPQASGGHSVSPPRKRTAAGVLDPPFPPKKPLRPIPWIPLPVVIRFFAALILIGLALAMLMIFWKIL
jgi:hypothetical protein